MKKPKRCGRHPYIVYYDGKNCPCCELLREVGVQGRKQVFGNGAIDKFKKWR